MVSKALNSGRAARRTRTTWDFYAAGKGLTAAQNGLALAGDWCSAAAFLGFTGLTALYGMDGALYAVGPLVAFCTVLIGPNALWPLVNPTVVALPLGILGAVLGSLLSGRDAEHAKRFGEVTFRIQTGLRSNQS